MRFSLSNEDYRSLNSAMARMTEVEDFLSMHIITYHLIVSNCGYMTECPTVASLSVLETMLKSNGVNTYKMERVNSYGFVGSNPSLSTTPTSESEFEDYRASTP